MSTEESNNEEANFKKTSSKIDISLLKYFWQASPLAGSRKDSIPKFLRKISVLKNFSDGEIYILSKYLHKREYKESEAIFRQGNTGVGFYLIFSGHVDILVEKDDKESEDYQEHSSTYLVSLERYDFFGELALLQENSIRNASAVAKDDTLLLGIFKPDVEDLMIHHPLVAARLLQSVSMIIANRLFSLTQEVRSLKFKLAQIEKAKNEQTDIKN